MTRPFDSAVSQVARATVALLLAASPVVAGGAPGGADLGSASDYLRLPLYQCTWPALEDNGKQVQLPKAAEQGTAEQDALLQMEWFEDGQLAFWLRDKTSSPFLTLAESSASGFELDRRGELGRFTIHRGDGLEALAIRSVYSPGNTRSFSQTEAQWTVCVLEPKARAESCQETALDVSSFVWQVGYAPEARWMHGAVDSEGERGFKTVSIPLLRDHDGDGYTDLVLWRRFEVSPEATSEAATPEDDAPFELHRDELWLVRYEPASRSFTQPTLISGPTPAAELATYHELLGSL